jgi:hypothetical protein
LRGEAGVRNFTDDAVKDLTIRNGREKIRLISDEEFSTDEARLAVHLRDGNIITRITHEKKASMTKQSLERKFYELVGFGSPHCDADKLLKNFEKFSEMPNIIDLITMTTSQP